MDTVESADDSVVRVRNLTKTFRREDGTTITPVNDVSLDVERGSVLVLLGPSGCGKTTLLRCMAGLEHPDVGSIEIDGRTVFSSSERIQVPVERRAVSMVFQSYALWPHMTAADNVSYPLESLGIPKGERTRRIAETMGMLGVTAVASQYPGQMSGGQQQRVAVARAIVNENPLVLFDEPLSNIDAKVREQLRIELLRTQRAAGFTAVYVTHDQIEALILADYIAVLNDGKIEQLGTPEDIYKRPRTRYVAQFIGTVNEFPGIVTDKRGEHVEVSTTLGTMTGISTADDCEIGASVVAIARPESFVLGDGRDDNGDVGAKFTAKIESSLFLGSHTEHVGMVGDTPLRILSPSLLERLDGSSVTTFVASKDVVVLPAGPRGDDA